MSCMALVSVSRENERVCLMLKVVNENIHAKNAGTDKAMETK